MVIAVCVTKKIYLKKYFSLSLLYTDSDRNMYYSNNYFNQESSNIHQPQGNI